jgi:hypothetical protein
MSKFDIPKATFDFMLENHLLDGSRFFHKVRTFAINKKRLRKYKAQKVSIDHLARIAREIRANLNERTARLLKLLGRQHERD